MFSWVLPWIFDLGKFKYGLRHYYVEVVEVEKRVAVFKCETCGFQTEDLWIAFQHARHSIGHKVVVVYEG